MSLLEVNDLSVAFPTMDGVVRAVRGVSFQVDRGRTLGLVGESGSGKSVTAMTMLGLTTGADVGGEALFEGRDLLLMEEDELRTIRGAEVAMIFQDPLSSLHPYYRVGWQIVEMIRAHTDMNKDVARRRAIELLGTVGIPRPAERVDDYPHQFSGGMRQRAMIAMALALHPKLLIADEPTTALDATVQAQIIELMVRLQREFGMALIMITHDLGVVAQIADDVMVMYAGKIVEKADLRTAYYGYHHPYTMGLLRSVPVPTAAARKERLHPITGQPPSLINVPSGCTFHPRCRFVMDRCLHHEPALRPVDGPPGHVSACWLPPEAVGPSAAADSRRLAEVEKSRTGDARKVAAQIEASLQVIGGASETVVEEPSP